MSPNVSPEDTASLWSPTASGSNIPSSLTVSHDPPNKFTEKVHVPWQSSKAQEGSFTHSDPRAAEEQAGSEGRPVCGTVHFLRLLSSNYCSVNHCVLLSLIQNA